MQVYHMVFIGLQGSVEWFRNLVIRPTGNEYLRIRSHHLLEYLREYRSRLLRLVSSSPSPPVFLYPSHKQPAPPARKEPELDQVSFPPIDMDLLSRWPSRRFYWANAQQTGGRLKGNILSGSSSPCCFD